MILLKDKCSHVYTHAHKFGVGTLESSDGKNTLCTATLLLIPGTYLVKPTSQNLRHKQKRCRMDYRKCLKK